MNRVKMTRLDLSTGGLSHVTHPGIKFKGKDRYKILYHYTSFDTFLKIYDKKTLKFGEAVHMNDIFEANKKLLVDTPNKMPLLYALKDVISSYKQISFTMNYDSLIKGCMSNSMWYHYGDKRNGVCIEFDFNKIHLPEDAITGIITYKYLLDNYSIYLPPTEETKLDVENFVRKNIKKIFFEKTFEWKYENEFRLLCQNKEFLNIDGAISALYFTSCDSDNVKAAENLVKGEFPVKFIDYMQECGDITPIDNSTETMRKKIEKNNKNKKPLMLEAQEFYENNGNDKTKPLIMDSYSL